MKKRDFYILLCLAILISVAGIANIYSATHGSGGFWIRQSLWLLLSVFSAIILFQIDYMKFYNWRWVIYIFTLLLLLMVKVIGVEGGGAKRWLSFGVWNFQPSELAKLSILVLLSGYIEEKWKPEGWSVREVFLPLLLIFIPAGMIALQPDLGTAGLIVITGFLLLAVSGMKWRALLICVLVALMSLPVMWEVMRDYQRARIISFLNPYADPLGKGYHILQSIIAIGSGGITGKGFFHGTQSVLKFLPSRHTDFGFSVWCEEHGLIGAIFLLSLYMALIFLLLRTSFYAKRRFGAYLVLGVALLFMIQCAINLLMVLGMFPVVGIPLPFFAYGGSSLLVSFAALGISCSVIWDRVKGRFI